MSDFQQFKLRKQLNYAIEDLGFVKPTPIQEQSFNVILSGKDVVGIAQTGTGKTFAYMLPILDSLKYSKDLNPKVLILVPTRELVLQVVENINSFSKYINVRVMGVYGGTNVNTQVKYLKNVGADIIVATPGRLYDLHLNRAIKFKEIKRLVVDEVDVMLDLGFRFQLTNILDLLPKSRQNIMYSATMTDDVDNLIEDYFSSPEKITVAVSGTPLKNIEQKAYNVENFFTKINLLEYILMNKEEYPKVLVFSSIKRSADKIYESLQMSYGQDVGVLHANKTQNFRIKAINDFNDGNTRILVATDVMARGLDIDNITHVINFDVPKYPQNYMHRIGRTGRAEALGTSILLYTKKEIEKKEAIEELMNLKIPNLDFPGEVEIAKELAPEELPYNVRLKQNLARIQAEGELPPGFHEKKAKNMKEDTSGSKRKREMAAKYSKPKTRGNKIQHNKTSGSRNKR